MCKYISLNQKGFKLYLVLQHIKRAMEIKVQIYHDVKY